MKRYILNFLVIVLFLPYAMATDSDLVPGKRFKSMQIIPQLEAAFRTNEEEKLMAAAKKLTHIYIDTKWQMFESMMERDARVMPSKDEIEYNLGFVQYEFEKGTRRISNTKITQSKVDFKDIDNGLEDLLRKLKCNDLKSYLAWLYRYVLHLEICSFALKDSPDSIWKGVEYSRIITAGELDREWHHFSRCYNKVCDNLFPASGAYYLDNKLSAAPRLFFIGYDVSLEEAPKGWVSWVWNAFRSCGKKIQRKKEIQADLYLAQMSIRLLQYAVSPDFQAVLNPGIEKRILFTSWNTIIYESFCFCCLKYRGLKKGKPYELLEWKKVPATKRTKHSEIEKKLGGKVNSSLTQTVKRGLGLQSLAEKKDAIFNETVAEYERLLTLVSDQSEQLALAQTGLLEAKDQKNIVEAELLKKTQDIQLLKSELERLKKDQNESKLAVLKREIDELASENKELTESMLLERLEAQRLKDTLEDIKNLSDVQHQSYLKLEKEGAGKDALILELRSRCAALPDAETVKNMSALIHQLRDKISTFELQIHEQKKKIHILMGEVHDLNQKLIAQNSYIEHLKNSIQHSEHEEAYEENLQVERDEINQVLEKQTTFLEEQRQAQSQLQMQLASAKTFLEGGESNSFLHAKPSIEPGDGESELIQGLAVKIIRMEDQLRLAYIHVQQLYVWSAYLEGGWASAAQQLQSVAQQSTTEGEIQKYDIYAGGELFRLTWTELSACAKEYLREHVISTREGVQENITNDNNG